MTKEQRPHPDHEWLLLMSDGELAPEARATMQKHLEACWECRHELQQIEGAIGDAVRYRKEVLARHLPPPPNPWRDLSAGFAQIDSELAPSSMWSRVSDALRMPRFAIPLAAAALGATVFIARTSINVEPDTAEVRTPITVPSEPAGAPAMLPGQGGTLDAVPPTSTAEPAVPATPGELAHSAILVAQLLRARGADLGDPIEILRTANRVVVRGVGLDPARARELEPVLKEIPFVEFRQSVASGTSNVSAVGRFAGANGDSPFQKELERALGGQANVDSLAAESLDQAETMMARAHALRRLDEQFSSDNLSPEDEDTLRVLRGEHAGAMAAAVGLLERTLAPALRSLAAAPAPLQTERPTVPNLFASARRLESSIAELTGTKAVLGPVDELPGRLAADLASASSLARSFAGRN